jgi:hypothetical protein
MISQLIPPSMSKMKSRWGRGTHCICRSRWGARYQRWRRRRFSWWSHRCWQEEMEERGGDISLREPQLFNRLCALGYKIRLLREIACVWWVRLNRLFSSRVSCYLTINYVGTYNYNYNADDIIFHLLKAHLLCVHYFRSLFLIPAKSKF